MVAGAVAEQAVAEQAVAAVAEALGEAAEVLDAAADLEEAVAALEEAVAQAGPQVAELVRAAGAAELRGLAEGLELARAQVLALAAGRVLGRQVRAPVQEQGQDQEPVQAAPVTTIHFP